MNNNLLPFITKALLKGSLRLHSSNKQLTRQHLYKLLRMNNIRTLRVVEGPNDELWLIRKEVRNA